MTALAGHISHLYEDLDIRFRDIKTIFKGLGYADIHVYEKLDGQNLFIGWDFDNEKLKVARNKQNVKDGGLDRYGLSLKFGDRPEIETLFIEAYDVLSKAIGSLSHNVKSDIFGSMGSVWFPIEIINPDIPNTIHYSNKSIVFHEYGPILFGFDGNPISKALPRNLEMLKRSVSSMNDKIHDWKIFAPERFPLKPIDESIILDACNKIEEIQKKYSQADGNTIKLYASERLKQDMQRFPLVPEHVRIGAAKSIVKMTGAPSINSLLLPLDKNTKQLAKDMIEEEKNKIFPMIILPIENIVHKFSSSLISKMKSNHIEDVNSESERIKNEYDRCCDIIRNSGNEKHIELLKSMHPKVGAGQVTMEGLVFLYNDKLYKITGSYAPINRIIATVKYSEKKPKSNPNDIPLAMFMQSG